MKSLIPGQWHEHLNSEKEEPRLDVYITRIFPELSRSAAQRLIDENHVRVNGSSSKASYKIQQGDKIEIFLPSPQATELKAQEIPLQILFQDEHIAVIEKPAGLVVHPAAGHPEGTLVNALLHHLKDLSSGSGIGGELRPGIIHRIDQNTSGVLLVTKTDKAHQDLSVQFKEHTISRRYTGLCWGILPSEGEWNAPLARDPKERKRMAIVDGGKKAVTRFRSTKYFGDALTLFEAELLTGRTHQVRVHFASHGFPLAGDDTYASASRSARNRREAGMKILRRHAPEAANALANLDSRKRQFLHAAHLGFSHPVRKEWIEFSSDLPEDLASILRVLEPMG